MEVKNIESLDFSGRAAKELWKSAKWAKLQGVISIVLYAILVSLGIFTGLAMSLSSPNVPYQGLAFSAFYFIFLTTLLFVPGILLLRFGSIVQQGIVANNEERTYVGLKNLRLVLQLWGILIIVVILLISIQVTIATFSRIF